MQQFSMFFSTSDVAQQDECRFWKVLCIVLHAVPVPFCVLRHTKETKGFSFHTPKSSLAFGDLSNNVISCA
jgi:hypothetical protein